MRKVKIALLGLGTVGKGVYEIINKNKEEIEKKTSFQIEISKILVKDISKKRDINVPNTIITDNFDDILEDRDIEIVVELIGGMNPSKEYIIKAMNNKKHIVTANKLLVASCYGELAELSLKNNVKLYFEASVAGGIPIIQVVNESLTGNKINKIIGIINGTTNYILTKMTNCNLDFQTALEEAQNNGYAELEPSSDIEAYDSVYKLSILSSLAFYKNIDFKTIYREGITNISPIDIKYAKELGYVIKLVAIAKKNSSKLELRVHPAMVPLSHPLSNVNDCYNAILIHGNAVGDLMLYGKGAGSLPTGSAVVADIISALRDYNLQPSKKISFGEAENICSIEEITSEYYIRISVKDVIGVLGEISTILGKNNVSIYSFIQKGKKDGLVPLVFVTHCTKEININKSINEIKALDTVVQIDNIIRVEKE